MYILDLKVCWAFFTEILQLFSLPMEDVEYTVLNMK